MNELKVLLSERPIIVIGCRGKHATFNHDSLLNRLAISLAGQQRVKLASTSIPEFG